MKRARVRIRPRLFAIVGGVALLAVLMVYSVDLIRSPPAGLDEAALERIDNRNREAAAIAAARQRADSAASTKAAETLRATQNGAGVN